MTDAGSEFDDRLAELAAQGHLLPALRLIVDRTGCSTAQAKRFHDEFVATRGITVDPMAVEIQAANLAELQEPADES